VDGLLPNQNNNVMFANTIKSNGFSVDFMFNKRIANHTSSKTNVALEFEDFDLKAVNQHYQPMILDHRRKIITFLLMLIPYYDYKTAKDRFYLHQGRKRAIEGMVNMLVHGGTKYNKQKQEKTKANGKFKRKKE
ncbi:hypothetical protein BCV71DRAFT_154284, partial [Rhizopus microsporus]